MSGPGRIMYFVSSPSLGEIVCRDQKDARAVYLEECRLHKDRAEYFELISFSSHEALRTELEKEIAYRKHIESIANKRGDSEINLMGELERLKAERAKDKEVIEFYAECVNWDLDKINPSDVEPCIKQQIKLVHQGEFPKSIPSFIAGKRARARLKETETTEDGAARTIENTGGGVGVIGIMEYLK